MGRYRRTLNAHGEVRESSQAVWFQLYNILEKAKLSRQVKDHSQGLRGAGGEGQTGGAQGIFRAMKSFWRTPSWWIHGIMYLTKPRDMHNTESELPNIHYRFQLRIMYQYWFINHSKCTTQMQAVNNKTKRQAGRMGVGDRSQLYFMLNVSINLKLF